MEGGAVFTIAALTLEQIESFVAPLEDVVPAKQHLVKGYILVSHALNNVYLDDDGEYQYPEGFKPWDEAKVRRVIDLQSFKKLQEEIIKFSGFTSAGQNSEKVAVPGESVAASDAANCPSVQPESLASSISGTSDAASRLSWVTPGTRSATSSAPSPLP
jgi:hypothetical protein